MAKKKFLNDLEDFVKDYKLNGITNNRKVNKLLKETSAYNKENVINDIMKRIDEHRLYEEDDFPYLYYVEKLLQPAPEDLNSLTNKK